MSEITVLESLEFLSPEEESERLRLERQVERAFYQAGLALKTLRDKKLYRSNHSTFQEYCRSRFGFTRRSAYYLIDAVGIVDNLKKSELKVHKLPTSETQCRPLKSLEPQQQRKAWTQAVEKANGGVPSAKIVKEVVNQIKEKDRGTEIENNSSTFSSNDNGRQIKSKIRFVALENPTVGQRVRICSQHPLFPQQEGTIAQLPNNRSGIVELDNQQRELIEIKDLEIQRIVDSNGNVTPPSEGLNYTPGPGIEYYVKVQEDTWNELNEYAAEIGAPTLNGAIRRLLEERNS